MKRITLTEKELGPVAKAVWFFASLRMCPQSAHEKFTQALKRMERRTARDKAATESLTTLGYLPEEE